MTRVLEPEDQAADVAPLPPDLEAIAAAGDAAVRGAALPPGGEQLKAAEQAERQREVAEFADVLKLAAMMGGKVEPLVPKYYTPEACDGIAEAYFECADKYGWTWHKTIATGPEIKLGAAIVIPGFMVWKDRRDRLAAEQAKAEGQAPAQVTDGAAPVGVAPQDA